MTPDFSPYAEFHAHAWQHLLDGVDADWSWDRKACYLYLQALTQGTNLMAGKRGRKPAQNETAAMLVQALDFLSVVPDKAADPNYVVINGPVISVNNGVVRAGVTMGSDFPADAVAKMVYNTFAASLVRVGKQLEIIFGDDFLSIEAGDFNAEIPNVPIDVAHDGIKVDPAIAPLNNAFRDALTKVMRLTSDTAEELLTASIAVTGQTVLATKRHTLIEAWHGNDMPNRQIFLPKQFAQALSKTTANLVSFGFSPSTFTVHFENGAFLQTNTYPTDSWEIEGMPDGAVFNMAVDMLDNDADGVILPAPHSIAEYMKALLTITKADVRVSLGRIESVDGMAAIDAKDVTGSFVVDPARFVAVDDLVDTIKLVSGSPMRILFWGVMVRGAVIVDAAPPALTNPVLGAGAQGLAEPPRARVAAADTAAGWGAPPNPVAPPAAVAAAPAEPGNWVPPAPGADAPAGGGLFGDDDE